jgi:hypothetical protein
MRCTGNGKHECTLKDSLLSCACRYLVCVPLDRLQDSETITDSITISNDVSSGNEASSSSPSALL